ncbi:MAG: tyrosine-type recombinase/integrase [Candidatus Binatia bacterium]
MKKIQRPNALARALRDYFGDHLCRLRGMSPHTIHSYRDSVTLLLRFVAARRAKPVARLDIDDLDAEQVAAFLGHLEQVRSNSVSTRNVRLAAIHGFFRYLASRHPDRLDHCQRVLGVPFKRTGSRPVDYLEYDEIRAVLTAIDRRNIYGRSDYALLAMMFNTGARVQEILDLRPCDLQLVKPFHARLVGKGRKERLCPLWSQTAELLRELLAEHGIDAQSSEPLFRNRRGQPLTRFGVRYILGKYCRLASRAMPTLVGKRLHPHSMRHSTALHLLKSGVDLVTIGHWLGHASVNTTNRYVTVDLETKRAAISKAKTFDDGPSPVASWRKDASVLEWLEAL